MENAFAESQEMVVSATELTLNPASHAFYHLKMAATAISGTTKTCCSTIARPGAKQELAAEDRRHGGQ